MAARRYILDKALGKVVSRQEAHEMLDAWLDTASNGHYELRLERKTLTRSVPQNKLMWVWFQVIATAWTDATGRAFSKEDIHDYYCRLLLPAKLAPTGVRLLTTTRTLTTEQMADFLTKVQADAATEFGIDLPSPESRAFEYLAEEYQV